MMRLYVWCAALLLSFTRTDQPAPVQNTQEDLGGWYITHDPRSVTDLEDEQDFKEGVLRATNKCLDLSGSAKVAILKSEFSGKLSVWLYDVSNDAIRMTTRNKDDFTVAANLKAHGGLDLVLYGENAVGAPRIPELFWYSDEWDSLFVPAMRMSKEWFCSGLLHQLWHAHNRRVRTAKKIPWNLSVVSAVRVDEEVQALELERDVLNAQTNGQYVLTLNTYLIAQKGRSLEQIQQDLLKRNTLINSPMFPQASDTEMSIRAAQTFLDVTFLFIEKNGGGVVEKRQQYLDLMKKYGS